MNLADLTEDMIKRSIEVTKIISKLKNNDKKLTKVSLEKKGFHHTDTPDLTEALKLNNHIVSLSMNGCCIHKGGAIKFAEFLETNSSLTDLHMKENMLEQGGAQAIKRALKRNITLIDLDISNDRPKRVALRNYTHPNKTTLAAIERLLTSNRELKMNCETTHSNSHYAEVIHRYQTSIPNVVLESAASHLIKALNMKQNLITEVPKTISNLKSLQILVLSQNQISKLPGEIGLLTDLQVLQLDSNKLTEIPTSISNLTDLKTLDLSSNLLDKLPLTLGKMTHLTRLGVDLNPLSKIPRQVIDTTGSVPQQTNLLKYLRNASEGVKPVYKMKMMVVGKGNVGKTVLLKKLTAEGNKTKSKADLKKADSKIALDVEGMSTDGIDIHTWEISNPKPNEQEPVVFSCWDMGGQEIYYTTHQFFLSERSMYVIVYNIVEESSLKKVQHWLESISVRAPASPIFIVATHLDDKQCAPKFVDDALEKITQFTTRYANIKYVTAVSCKDGTNIDELREELITIAMEQPHMGTEVPQTYLGLEEKVTALKGIGKSTMTWDDFHAMAVNECSVPSEDVLSVTEFLHDLGVLVYFNDSGLKDIVVCDPQFLTNVMSTIITTKANFVKDGILKHMNLPQIWRPPEFPLELHETLLSLLEKFEISFRISNNMANPSEESIGLQGESLFPCLLPDERPDFRLLWPEDTAWVDEGHVQYDRWYRLEFIPPGLISRLMVRLLYFSDAQKYWANGIVVRTSSDWSLVEYFPNLCELRVKVRGSKKAANGSTKSNAEELLRVITETFESLVANWYNMHNVKKFIPCRHCLVDFNLTTDPHLFPFEKCELAAATEQWMIKCGNGATVALDVLVPDLALSDFEGCRIDFEKEIKIEKEIGHGGFGVIYKAQWNGSVVAVKQLKTESQNDAAKAFDEFRREVWLMSALNHNNIVMLKGFCINPFAMVMEFIAFGDMYNFLKDPSKECDWPLKIKCAFDVASGMRFLHNVSPPLLHRDLKTPNILMSGLSIDSPVVAKVADFGLSSRLFLEAFKEKATTRAIVNPTWLAPEIMREEEYTEKSDVYSFGIILWEIATRQHPFSEFQFKFMSMLEQMVMDGKRPTIPRDTPPRFEQLIEKCWAPDPKNRPDFISIVEEIHTIIDMDYPLLKNKVVKDRPNNKKIRSETRQSSIIPTSENKISLSGKLVQSSETEEIRCIISVQKLVWCGCGDGSILIYDAENGSLLEKLNQAHDSKILDMIYVEQDETIWTSCENTLAVWKPKDPKSSKVVSDVTEDLPDSITVGKQTLLEKRGGGKRSTAYRQRWVVLQDSILKYYKKKNDKKPAGQIDLTVGFDLFRGDKLFCFTIAPKLPETDKKTKEERQFFFRAKAEDEFEDWLNTLFELRDYTSDKIAKESKVGNYIQFLKRIDYPSTYTIHSLAVTEEAILGGATDGKIFEFDSFTHQLRRTINIDTVNKKAEGYNPQREYVSCLTQYGGFVWACVGLSTIVRLNEVSLKPDNTFLQGHTGKIKSIIGVNGTIWSCCTSGSIRIWSITTGQCAREFIADEGLLNRLLFVGGDVWSAGEDHAKKGSVKVWDPSTCQCVKTLPPHNTRGVTDLLLVLNRTIWTVSSEDRNVTVWN